MDDRKEREVRPGFPGETDEGLPPMHNDVMGISRDELDDIRHIIEEGTPASASPPVPGDGVEEISVSPGAVPSRREKRTAPKSSARSELFDWAQALVTSIILVGVVFSFVARVIGVDGPSMENTLFGEGPGRVSQKLVISKLFYTPKQGDIIIFTKKDIHKTLQNSDEDQPLVKRVIATGGQTVDINFNTHEVYVDDVLLDEPYIKEPISSDRRGDIQYPFTVPEGQVFVMGDNRNVSADSRDSRVGTVDTRYILGKVLLRVWPLEDFGVVK